MSGGVIKENGSYLFAKVDVEGIPYWYLAPVPVKAGERVKVPFGKRELLKEGVVVRTEECTAQTAPVPMNRIREIAEVIS